MAHHVDSPEIRRSDDFAAALTLARDALLEGPAYPEAPLAMWGAFDGDRMIGTVSLNDLGGLPLVERIAVTHSRRGRGLGRRLLAVLEEEASRNGHSVLYATARAPGFFVANGYAVLAGGAERDLLLADCAGCEQHAVSCRPQAVFKRLRV
ncbi:MAG TPA: GNAT family N-acetyltransferase [Thermoleophilia bacterium]|nr:GNAT family N-acetyltransferase [Thermoleophilia bacterium]